MTAPSTASSQQPPATTAATGATLDALPLLLLIALLWGSRENQQLQQAWAGRCRDWDPADEEEARRDALNRNLALNAAQLHPEVRTLLAHDQDTGVRVAYWSREDLAHDDLAAHLARERSARVRAEILKNRPDLPADLVAATVDARTLDGAKAVLRRAADLDPTLVAAAIVKLAGKNLTSEEEHDLDNAAALPGVGRLVHSEEACSRKVRALALADPELPGSVVAQAVRDWVTPGASTPQWRADYNAALRQILRRPDLGPTLARVVVHDLPRNANPTDSVRHIAGTGPLYDEHVDALGQATDNCALARAWEAVPADQRSAAAWLVAKSQACDAALLEAVEPLLRSASPELQRAHLGSLAPGYAATLVALRRPEWLARYVAAVSVEQVRTLLALGPDWAERVSHAAATAAAAGDLDINRAAGIVASENFHAPAALGVPPTVLLNAMPRPGQQNEAVVDAVLAGLDELALRPEHRDALTQLLPNHTGPVRQLCEAVAAAHL